MKERLDIKNSYSVEEHKRVSTEELLERGYEEDVIRLWLDNIE